MILFFLCVSNHPYADVCSVNRGKEKIPLYGKCCIKKEDYYIVVPYNDRFCWAALDKVSEKEDNLCPNFESEAQILLESLERYHKRNRVRNQKKGNSSDKKLGFRVNGFLVVKESEVPKDKVVDYTKSLKRPNVKSILYFQENQISEIGTEIRPANLKDVLEQCH